MGSPNRSSRDRGIHYKKPLGRGFVVSVRGWRERRGKESSGVERLTISRLRLVIDSHELLIVGTLWNTIVVLNREHRW